MPAKHPSAVRCYTFNAKGFLKTDTIASHTVTGENITIDSSSESGGIITITVSGGTNGAKGVVTVTFTTNTSPAKTEVALFYIPIDDQKG